MPCLASTARMLCALRSARSVTFSAYVLRPGPVERALEAAAGRGARVQVRLDGYLWGGSRAMAEANRDVVRALRRAGADARLVHLADADGPGLHMKAAVCDGRAFLDDCNWNMTGDTVVRDDTPADVRAIRNAALQRDVPMAGNLRLTKADALAGEAAVLRAHVKKAVVETEALHSSSISSALRKLAQAGAHCRLLVSEREAAHDKQTQRMMASLKKAGVDVRTVRSSEKLAVAGASRAWVGSADATSTYYDGDRIDWGLGTRAPHLVRALQARFNSHWKSAKPLRCT